MTTNTDNVTQLKLSNDMWVVRVERGDGKAQEYRCSSESQAKALAQMLSGHEA